LKLNDAHQLLAYADDVNILVGSVDTGNKNAEAFVAATKEIELEVNAHKSNSIILPVVLYGCETWSLTLREERRLRVFENRVLRRVFGPKRVEVTREWRNLHNEIIVRVVKSRRMRWAGHVSRMGKGRGVHRVPVWKPEGKKSIEKTQT